MKIVVKSHYRSFLSKGEQHERAAHRAQREKDYDAAITNFTIALINYMDALSVNRFGKNLSSDNHESAPVILCRALMESGITGFRQLSLACVAVLRMKNRASYTCEELTKKEALMAQHTVEKVKNYVASKVDSTVIALK